MEGGRRVRQALCAAVLLFMGAGVSGSRAPPQPADADAAVLAQLTQLRDVFTRRIDEEGYRLCAAPHIELGPAPAFARYLPQRNTILLTPWSALAPEERQAFADLAHASGNRASARAVFESGTYRWVFVHELGHWWQNCRGLARPPAYAADNGASRITLAFWRERDPGYAAGFVQGFQGLLDSVPSPVPAAASVQDYFDAHFSDIVPSDQYTWFQAQMISALAREQPRPSFHKALSQPLYPW